MMSGGFPANKQGFSWKGKTLLSGIDPAGRALRAAQAAAISDRTLYLCPSPLFGYGLERLLERIAPFSHSAVLCIEAEPELFALAQEHFGAELKNNVQLCITNKCEAETLCALLRHEWGPRFFRRVEMIRLNGGWQLHRELYDTLAESLRREIALDWGNAMTLARLGRRYIRNALRNLALIPRCPSLDRLSFGGAPALVLGAGPSLDQTLDGLQSHFGEALQLPEDRPFKIICVDTCLSVLKERGIMPDLAVILESQHWNLEDFTGLSGWNVPAAFDLSALPRSAGVLAGNVLLFFTPWTSLTIFERLAAAGVLPAMLPPLGSVGLSAAYIARRLTEGTIVTAGLDFSFTLDSYHARSTPGHKNKLRRHHRFTSLLNADAAFGGAVFAMAAHNGGKVFSTPSMRNYRDLFEREFGGDTRIYAIAGSGLPLGVSTLSLEAALEALSSKDLTQRRVEPSVRDAKEGDTFANYAQPSASPRLGEMKFEINEKLHSFIQAEQNRLTMLRNMLSGETPMNSDTLVTLIDECDYLWAHFPDYAASVCRPTKADIESGAAVSFLKRLRVEIDPFLKLWELARITTL